MKRSRFTETRAVAILRESDSGVTVTELCCKHGISNATYYKWKHKYGMDASDLKKLKELEAENSELKKMFADLSPENKGLKALIEKKRLGPPKRQDAVRIRASTATDSGRKTRSTSCAHRL